MILIDNKLISDDIIERKFVCNLSACKGACCVAGDAGAPVEKTEVEILKKEIENIKSFLTPEGVKTIEQQGVAVREYKDRHYKIKTPLMNGGACAYAVFDKNGIASCGIEKAFQSGATTFQKPISCHLYPIRIKRSKGMVYLNYEEWDICAPACEMGKQLKMPVYRFLKSALIRKFGQEFYNALEAAAIHVKKNPR
jgi:hypothetical protein